MTSNDTTINLALLDTYVPFPVGPTTMLAVYSGIFETPQVVPWENLRRFLKTLKVDTLFVLWTLRRTGKFEIPGVQIIVAP